MALWYEIAENAFEQHQKALIISKGDPTATALIAAASELTEIEYSPVRKGDGLLEGGYAKLVPSDKIIWFDQDAGPKQYNFFIAHEFAHFWLGHPADSCTGQNFDPEINTIQVSLGVEKIEGYSPQEKKEREANLFARDFLLPGIKLRQWFLVDKLNIENIAAMVGVPIGMVLQQLSAVLVPNPNVLKVNPNINSDFELDPSQKEAAFYETGPLLVEAGPGTGKTKTLLKRVAYLVNRGVPPEAILILTFSNRVAEEMVGRISQELPAEASKIWVGTFHAFGLEILRKYGEAIGLPMKPGLLDPIGELLVLEKLLPRLNLNYYLDLVEPSRSLADIRTAISRAKDELVSANEYYLEAQKMLEQAITPEEKEEAEKALEVAGVYSIYQEHLDKENLLDFGDLIFKAYRLLVENSGEKKAIREKYPYILVDEYQDVNYACGRFIEELAGEGKGLWVVGDLRQAIYRFRGASPQNITILKDRFPSINSISLKRNYRSRPAILKVFSALAPIMAAAGNLKFSAWDAHQDDEDGQVVVGIAETLEAEIKGVAEQIRKNQNSGIEYRDQAILCRSHTIMERVAKILEKEEIPVLYLGDLFEREEIRDLISLLSLVCEGNGTGLARVACFKEYQIPIDDVKALISYSREQEVGFPAVLKIKPLPSTISGEGLKGINLLSGHLEDISFGRNAWQFFVYYLFSKSNYLKDILEDTSIKSQQKGLAIFQFLQFVHTQQKNMAEQEGDLRRTFLNFIRKIEMLGEDRQLRQALEGAEGVVAVRLLTVHASKGLEFKAVYLPYLGNGHFPSQFRGEPKCTLPSGLNIPKTKDWHSEEEECLLFVALSRAQDYLCLSRANKYLGRPSKPHELLKRLKSSLPYPIDGNPNWHFPTEQSEISLKPSSISNQEMIFGESELKTYMDCSRRYHYQYILKLSTSVEESAYKHLHNSLHRLLDWLKEQGTLNQTVDEATALAQFSLIWSEKGPVDHPLEELYRNKAEAMVIEALDYFARLEGKLTRPEWLVKVGNAQVSFSPDQVELLESEDGQKVIIHCLKTGKPSKSEAKKPIYPLYEAAVKLAHPGIDYEVRPTYLGNKKIEPSQDPFKISGDLKEYETAIAGIQQSDFSPNPKDKRRCPSCPFYFICPAG